MAYIDQDRRSERMVAAALSALLLALVGYALINGLAYNALKRMTKQLSVISIKAPPPPPPPRTPQPPKQETKSPPPPVKLPPPVVPPPPAIPPTTSGSSSPTVGTGSGNQANATGNSSAASQASGVRPKGDPSDWVTMSDYTADALKNRESGKTVFRLDVGTDGKVTNCTISASSGFADLDETTCRLLARRSRFYPALDRSGTAIAGTFSGSVNWQIPGQ